MQSMHESFDMVGFIIAVETGDDSLTEQEMIDGMQFMIDTGTAYQLQGSWGRMADNFIQQGYCTKPFSPPCLQDGHIDMCETNQHGERIYCESCYATIFEEDSQATTERQ